MRGLETLSAEIRNSAGTGAARAARRQGRLPAIIYGRGTQPRSISLNPLEVTKAYHRGNFLSSLVNVKIDNEEVLVLPRDVQTHPVRDHIMHVDLLQVDERTRIEVEVPLHFLNEEESPGLKRGGVLNVVRHEVELSCPATAIPPFLEVDLAGLDIGDAVKISSIALAEGVHPTITDRDFTLATIAAPSALMTEAEEEEAEAEGEEAAEGEGEAEAEGEESKSEDED